MTSPPRLKIGPRRPPMPAKTFLWLVFGILGGGGLLMTLCIFGGIALSPTVKQPDTPTDALRDLARDYYYELREDRPELAYNLLCTRLREATPRAEYARQRRADALEQFFVGPASLTGDPATATAGTVTMTLVAQGHTSEYVVPMTKDNRGWKICGGPM